MSVNVTRGHVSLSIQSFANQSAEPRRREQEVRLSDLDVGVRSACIAGCLVLSRFETETEQYCNGAES